MGTVGVSASLLPPRAAPGVTRVSALPAGPRGRRGTMALAVGSVAPLHPAPASWRGSYREAGARAEPGYDHPRRVSHG